MNRSFSTQSFGKCIITGEHAVLRGIPAIVFPVHSRFLQLDWEDSQLPIDVTLNGAHGQELKELVWEVIEKAIHQINSTNSMPHLGRSSLRGKLYLTSNIPVGAGMGASAALCVAISRWFQFIGYVEEKNIYDFSRQLENIFHGESSGVDIAVSMTGQGLYFIRGKDFQSLVPTWQPNWYISYSGKRGVTKECVDQVKNGMRQNEPAALAVDEKMKLASESCRQALMMMTEENGFPLLCEGISLANECFVKWGLVEKHLQARMDLLLSHGAQALKPTGSGGGGFVLGLWKEKVSEEKKAFLELINLE